MDLSVIRALRDHVQKQRMKALWDQATVQDELSVGLGYARDALSAAKHSDLRLAIVVPYRDRASHLAEFMPYMAEYLPRAGIANVEFYVVEQEAGKDFNAGLLRNIGFLEAISAERPADYVCFHDVDCLPSAAGIDYSCPAGFRHTYGHTHCLGGVFLATRDAFWRSNGFPNDFFGWGREDVALQHRCQQAGILIDRSSFVSRWDTDMFRELPCRSGTTDCKAEFFRLFKERVTSGEYQVNTRRFKRLQTLEASDPAESQNGVRTCDRAYSVVRRAREKVRSSSGGGMGVTHLICSV